MSLFMLEFSGKNRTIRGGRSERYKLRGEKAREGYCLKRGRGY